MRRTPTVGIRLVSMLLDHIFTCIILVLPMIPIVAYFSQDSLVAGENAPPSFQFVFIGLLCLYFFKDSFGARSIAKRILKLQVVDAVTGAPASVGQCFVRNLFIIVWLVEVLVTLFRPQRRIGDLVAGTKVALYAPFEAKPEEQGILDSLNRSLR